MAQAEDTKATSSVTTGKDDSKTSDSQGELVPFATHWKCQRCNIFNPSDQWRCVACFASRKVSSLFYFIFVVIFILLLFVSVWHINTLMFECAM